MIKYFNLSFKILGNNMLFIQPLLFLFVTLAAAGSYTVLNPVMPRFAKIMLCFSLFLLVSAFTAGWLYINKTGIEDFDEKDSKEETVIKSIKNFKKFFEGTGEGFLKVLFSLVLLLVIYSGCIYFVLKLLTVKYGIPSFLYDIETIGKITTNEQLYNYVAQIPDTDKIMFINTFFSVNTVISILNYFSILFFAVLYFDKKNIFITFFRSLIFFFKNIFSAIIIMIYTFMLYIILNVFSLFLGANSLGFVILLVLITMYLNYYLILVFLFYYEKSKNDCNNGSKLVG